MTGLGPVGLVPAFLINLRIEFTSCWRVLALARVSGPLGGGDLGLLEEVHPKGRLYDQCFDHA
jgi:hypothetical protein